MLPRQRLNWELLLRSFQEFLKILISLLINLILSSKPITLVSPIFNSWSICLLEKVKFNIGCWWLNAVSWSPMVLSKDRGPVGWIAKTLHEAILCIFPKATDWNKIHTCTQNLGKPVYDCYNKFQIVFKENSGLPLDVDSTPMACNYLFANGFCHEFSLLVKRNGMKWKTMFILISSV